MADDSRFICRFFLFHVFESPNLLLSKGRQREAVTVVQALAYQANVKTWLTEDILNEIGGRPDELDDEKLATTDIIKRQLEKFSTQRIKPLFGYKRLGINTALVWFCWAAIGIGYPLYNAFLPQYLSRAAPNAPPPPVSVVYRNYAITSIVGLPGSIIACYTVDIKYFGRRGTMAIATLLSGIFLILFTQSADSGYQLAFSCLVAFFQNIMYGVLYAYTPGEYDDCHKRFILTTVRNLSCSKPWNRQRDCILLQPPCWSLRTGCGHSRGDCRSEDSDLRLGRALTVCIHCHGLSADRDEGKAGSIIITRPRLAKRNSKFVAGRTVVLIR